MPTKKKRRVNVKELREKQKKYLRNLDEKSRLSNSGVGCSPRPNYNPLPIVSKGEVRYGNHDAGATITCGPDRPRNILSGKGGSGEQNCGSIRMTCGPMGEYKKAFDEDGNRLYADPSNLHDAATFYISEKSDVDDDWGFADGTVGNVKNRSCAVIRAESTRIASGGGGVQIIAGTSTDVNRVSVPNIDLICNNDDSQLQPIPKGENVKLAFLKLSKQIQDLTNIVSGFLESQMQFNAQITKHTHSVYPSAVIAPAPPGVPVVVGSTLPGSTFPSIECAAGGFIAAGLQGSITAPSIVALCTNSAFVEMNYFKNPSSETYINSRNVNVT